MVSCAKLSAMRCSVERCAVVCFAVLCYGILCCDVLCYSVLGHHLISLRQCSRIAYKFYHCVFHMSVYMYRYMIRMRQDKTRQSESELRSHSYTTKNIVMYSTRMIQEYKHICISV